jgi:UDP-glucose 4-epimerase
MRILIAGGFGYVGGRLAEYLGNAGHQIVLGTRDVTIPPVWLPQAEVARISWDEDKALNRICEGVDLIIHAAGMNAKDCAYDPVAAYAFNGLATSRLVSAATLTGVKKFFYLSTAHVYSSPLVGVITEDDSTKNTHPYATSHLVGEHAVLTASRRQEIEGVVLRLTNAFGAPMHKNVNCWMLLVTDLCKQAVTSRELVLKTNGFQHKDFIGLNQVCCVIERLAHRTELTPRKILNVGAGVSHSVIEMTQLIQQRCKSVLGFEPKIARLNNEKFEQQATLTYKTKNLDSLGISCKSVDSISEIDRLLRFCQEVFK